MSLYPVVGEITNTTSKAEVEWKIPDFFSQRNFKDNSWESPPFYFLNVEWCLRIDLNVKVFNDTVFWNGLYLVVRNPASCYSVTFALGIRNLTVPCKFGPETLTFDKCITSHGKEELFRRGSLKRSDTSDKALVVYCNAIANLPSTACQTTLLNSATALCLNFQEMLLSGRKSDVTITVRDQEYKAHKVILEARSPVFTAMFEHAMAEKKENIIVVEDCDPGTFQNFLQCVYSGRVENLTVDEAILLYMVSHKYTVTDIMEKCAHLMQEELAEDTVCDILALANRYNDADLKNSAEEFMAQNIHKIFSTNNWSTLMTENSLLQKYSRVLNNNT